MELGYAPAWVDSSGLRDSAGFAESWDFRGAELAAAWGCVGEWAHGEVCGR